MLTSKHLLVGAVALPSLLVLSSASARAADTTPTTERPSGPYQVAMLELSQGLRSDEKKEKKKDLPQAAHLAFRDGKLVNWWFVDHGWEAMHQHGSTVKLTTKGIEGELNLRIYDVRGSLQKTADLVFSIGRKANRFEGSFQATLSDGNEDSSWKGTAHGALLQPTGEFDSKAGWPSFAGPAGTLRASPNGPPLIDDLPNARPQWRSEATVPVSYGNAADDRYPQRAAGCRFGGGSSSPVYAEGVVYIAFYQPNMDIPPVSPGPWADKWFGDSLKAYAAEKKLIPEELRAIEDHWRKIADDVIVAMDARTGATLWRTTWPQRVYNLQTHKHRGTFGVPLVAAGKVFYPNFQNGLEVMDAKTGEALWEFPEFDGPPEIKFRPSGPPSQSPLLFGDTLVWSIGGTTYGLAAEDGKIRWENKSEGGYQDHSLREVQLGDRRFALVAGHRHGSSSKVRLIDPAKGGTLWMQEVGSLGCHEGLFANTLAVTDDKLVAYRHRLPEPDPKTRKISKDKITYHINAWKLSATGLEHLWEDSSLPQDEGPHLAIGDGIVYGVGRQLVRCLDLQSGRVLGEIVKEGFPHPAGSPHRAAPGSNPLLMVAGSKLILSPEGQHGKHGFILFDSDPAKLTLLGDQESKWVPPHASTTAYGRQPIVNPLVDDRMFFRGGNGIYCYDLRKPH